MITIAIPFHFGIPYLRQAVQSVLQQTSDAWQLVIRNDNPGEPVTLADLPELDHPRITYYSGESGAGMVANWNACLNLAKTTHVTLLHSDDELAPEYIATMQELISANPNAAALFCDAEVIGADGMPRFSFPDFIKRFLIPKTTKAPFSLGGEEGLTALLKGNFIFCPALCYNLNLLAGERFDATWRMVQDLEFTTRLLLQGKHLVGTPTRAYRYRRHDNNATVYLTKNRIRFDEEHALYAALATAAHSRGWTLAEKAAKHMTIVKLNLSYCALVDLMRGDLKAMSLKISKLKSLHAATPSQSQM